MRDRQEPVGNVPSVTSPAEMERRLETAEARFRETFHARQEDFARLKSVKLRKGEHDNVKLLEAVAKRGLAAVLRRRGPASSEEVLDLIDQFSRYGPRAILLTGSQRGGDFLDNQLRGRWAERVVTSMEPQGLLLIPFGPSGAAMPGEEDHRQVIMAYREIHLLEGKRPDLVAFERALWESFPEESRKRALSWPMRLLEPKDREILARARSGAEVKNSTWHYGRRREATGRPLAVTVKEEEIADTQAWSRTTGLPVVFFQVLFDEVYCMSFARMQEAISRGHLYTENDYESLMQRDSDKQVHHFYLTDTRHRCAQVTWPNKATAEVRVLPDGNVVPYINLQPAEATGVLGEVILQEIDYRPLT